MSNPDTPSQILRNESPWGTGFMDSNSFLAELKRRNVLRAAAFYAASAWLMVQVATQVFPFFHVAEWVVRWIVVAAAIGFPFAMLFSWFYEWTPDGLKRESEIDPSDSIAHRTGRKLDVMIIGVLSVAVVLLLTNTFVWHMGAGSSADANGTPVPANSIAVLPFANESNDKEQDYFSDGISEDLLNLLTRIPQLQVTARTSSFSFKGKAVAIPEIARQLHVARVLEGSVRKVGHTVRITAQLVDAATDTQLWSQTYDRKLDDIFAIQDEIAADVVKQLQVKLLGPVPKTRTTNPEAYAFFLQADQLTRLRTAEAYQQSDALFHKALAIDPRYAPAWEGLASNFANKVNLGLLSGPEGNAKTREAAMQALAIDPDYAQVHASLGLIALYGDNDLDGAAEHYQRALALDPAGLGVLKNSALLLVALGRVDEAQAVSEAVARRDPVNVSAFFNLGVYQRYAGRFDAAITNLRTVLSLAPNRGNAHAQLGTAMLLKGDAQGALAEIGQETSELWKMLALPMAYPALGRKAESDAALAALVAKYEHDAPYNIAYVYAFRGEADKAFEWLDKASRYGDSGLSDVVSENLFDKIHADPRWLPFLRKIGKAPEQLAKIAFKVTLPQDGKP